MTFTVRLVEALFVKDLGSSHSAVRAFAGERSASGFDLDFFGSFFINGKKNKCFPWKLDKWVHD